MEDTPGNDGSTIECVVEEAELNSGDKKQEETDIGDEMIIENELEKVQNDEVTAANDMDIEFVDIVGLSCGEINKMRNILEGTRWGRGYLFMF